MIDEKFFTRDEYVVLVDALRRERNTYTWNVREGDFVLNALDSIDVKLKKLHNGSFVVQNAEDVQPQSDFESCEECAYTNESMEGEHCRHCTHNAVNHFQRATNGDAIRNMDDDELIKFVSACANIRYKEDWS